MKNLVPALLLIVTWIEDDRCKDTDIFVLPWVARPYGNEQFVCCPIGCVSATEDDCPGLVEDDLPPLLVPDRTHEFSGLWVEPVDSAFDGVVGNQKSVAQRPKIGGSEGHAPGLIEGQSLDQCLHELTLLSEDIDKTAGTAVRYGIRDVNQAINVLDSKY